MRLSWLEPSRKVAKVYEATIHRFLKGGSGCVEVSLHWAGRSLARLYSLCTFSLPQMQPTFPSKFPAPALSGAL